MRNSTERGKEIRAYILANVRVHPKDIAQVAAKHFSTSRQTIAWHLKKLVDEGLLTATGKTRAREYKPKEISQTIIEMKVSSTLEEDTIWRERVLPLLEGAPQNVIEICQYGFTEMFNNVLSHSEAESVTVDVDLTTVDVNMMVVDDGIGIFKKIQRDFGLNDPRHALLELSKGKITTDQAHHTGEGIFFTSRMFDWFTIMSDELFYSRINQEDDWLIETEEKGSIKGTVVSMNVSLLSKRTTIQVFDNFAGADYDFSRTHVPIKLARYSTEQLVSRSQAKRVLARFERFNEVILDFADVEMIGRAFADEIFRVYQSENPKIKIVPLDMAPKVKEVIDQVIQARLTTN
jgi:anti-sigma regulatory factor (Ser/Thr protein kinase)